MRPTKVRLVLLFALAGCGSPDPDEAFDDVGDPPAHDAVTKQDRSDQPQLEPDGWPAYRDAARVTYQGQTFYRVEWDLLFSSEAQLFEHYRERTSEGQPTGSGERARNTKSAVFVQDATGFDLTRNRNDVLHIRYCVSTAFANHGRAVSEMERATAAWEAVANVNFDYVASADSNCVPSNSAIDFAVISNTWMGLLGVAGCATPSFENWQGAVPADFGCLDQANTVQRDVLVMDVAFIDAGGTPVTTEGTFRHELGHVLGLKHEHPYAPGGGGCPETTAGGRPLTPYDIESVMHYPQCIGRNRDLFISAADGVGLRLLYGMPVSWYTSARII